jgi:hypothetical protein
MAVLDYEPKGVVHQRVETIWKGEDLSKDVYTTRDIARVVDLDGGETRIERERIFNRDPQGFLTIQQTGARPENFRPPNVKLLLEQSKEAQVKRWTQSDGELFQVRGSMIDGIGVRRTYEVKLLADNQGRPIWESIEHEGLGKSIIHVDYDVDPSNLELTPVAPDRVYNLDDQRAELLQLLASQSRASDKEKVLRAYLDESGELGILVSIPRAVEAPGDSLKVNGTQIALAGSSFNRYVGLANSYVHAPVEYNGQYLFLKKAKVKQAPKTPFRMEFPLWQYDPAFKSQQPFLRMDTPASLRLIRTGSVEVKDIVRTSSITQLLTPMNIPFFLDKNFMVTATKNP